jgi:hypothetical protein
VQIPGAASGKHFPEAIPLNGRSPRRDIKGRSFILAVEEYRINGRPVRRQRRFGRTSGAVLTVLAYGLALVASLVLVQHGFQYAQRMVNSVQISHGAPLSARIVGYVGHGDERNYPTVIETYNVGGQISVLVAPGGDFRDLTVLEGPYVMGSDGPFEMARPDLRDITGDGHVDLLVTVRNETVVYVNDDGQFRLITGEERARLSGEWQ